MMRVNLKMSSKSFFNKSNSRKLLKYQRDIEELMDNYIRFHLNYPLTNLAFIKKNLMLSVDYSIERIIAEND